MDANDARTSRRARLRPARLRQRGTGSGALVAPWVFRNVDARLLLSNQPAKVTIDEKLQVTARVLDNLDIPLDDMIKTEVPVDQIITVPVKEASSAPAKRLWNALVPIVGVIATSHSSAF